MPTVADVLRRYGAAYLERFGAAMPAEHKKVLDAITACRTGQLGTVIYVCTSCGTTHAMGRSCGNRHCPTCQQDKTKAWLENQTDRLLPCPYFLLTFTVPAGLRASCAVTSGSPTPRCSRRPAPRSRPWPPTPSTSAPTVRLLRRAAHLGPHARLSSTRSLRRPWRWYQRRWHAMATLTRRFLRACESLVDSLPRQVPRRP